MDLHAGQSANDTQALAEGESVTETFTAARVSDEEGAYDEYPISITIYGSNDKPFITSTATNQTGYLKEAGHSVSGDVDSGTPMAFGELTAADVDANSEITWSVIGYVDKLTEPSRLTLSQENGPMH